MQITSTRTLLFKVKGQPDFVLRPSPRPVFAPDYIRGSKLFQMAVYDKTIEQFMPAVPVVDVAAVAAKAAADAAAKLAADKAAADAKAEADANEKAEADAKAAAEKAAADAKAAAEAEKPEAKPAKGK
jgi:hypothetical protein